MGEAEDAAAVLKEKKRLEKKAKRVERKRKLRISRETAGERVELVGEEEEEDGEDQAEEEEGDEVLVPVTMVNVDDVAIATGGDVACEELNGTCKKRKNSGGEEVAGHEEADCDCRLDEEGLGVEVPVVVSEASVDSAVAGTAGVEVMTKSRKKRKKKKAKQLVEGAAPGDCGTLKGNGTPGALVASLKEAMALVEGSSSVAETIREMVAMLERKTTDGAAWKLIRMDFLSILPSLLRHSCPEVVVESAEVLSVLALSSYEINCRLSKSVEILGAVSDMLSRRESELLLVGCHTMMDMAITAHGCSALQDVPGLPQQLLRLVSRLADILTRDMKAGSNGIASEPHRGNAMEGKVEGVAFAFSSGEEIILDDLDVKLHEGNAMEGKEDEVANECSSVDKVRLEEAHFHGGNAMGCKEEGVAGACAHVDEVRRDNLQVELHEGNATEGKREGVAGACVPVENGRLENLHVEFHEGNAMEGKGEGVAGSYTPVDDGRLDNLYVELHEDSAMEGKGEGVTGAYTSVDDVILDNLHVEFHEGKDEGNAGTCASVDDVRLEDLHTELHGGIAMGGKEEGVACPCSSVDEVRPDDLHAELHDSNATESKGEGVADTCDSVDEVRLDKLQCEDDKIQDCHATDFTLFDLSRDEATELFDVILAIVNTVLCDLSCLGVPIMSESLISLQKFWTQILRLQLQFEGIDVDIPQIGAMGNFIWAPGRRNQVAKLIMRLAMEQSLDINMNGPVPNCFFGEDGSCWEHFFQEHWESSPAMFTAKFLEDGLSTFFGENVLDDTPFELLKFLVDGMVGCPAAVADEVDSLSLYDDMEDDLGHLPVYNQDVRLVKCEGGAEVPYCIETETVSISSEDCIQAYNSGYTVVIRGLQFRCPHIAAISDGLAAELGQVTVGANLYLTPPESQGLGAHFDDHCVFVCQLQGHKQWNLYSQQELLPRLYSFKALPKDVKEECATQYALDKGDILYIPRGFPHKACTGSSGSESTIHSQVGDAEKRIDRNMCCQSRLPPVQLSVEAEIETDTSTSNWIGASLHLSFGVEVEPAFEWEGLLHIALHLWAHQGLQLSTAVSTSPCKMDICEGLLHVAIRNLGKTSVVFRKACVLKSDAERQLLVTAQDIFHRMLSEVNETVDFHNVFQEYQEGVSSVYWLQHLLLGNVEPNCSIDEISGVGEDVFTEIKSRFVQEASFEESVKAQNFLLSTFRRCRKQFMNGLLALHSSYSNVK